MKRSALLALMCVVTAAHVAVIAAVAGRSTISGIATRSAGADTSDTQIISLVSPTHGATPRSAYTILRETNLSSPNHTLAKLGPFPKKAQINSVEKSPKFVPLPDEAEISANSQSIPDLIVETAVGELALAEVLHARLPYLANLVTLEFLIDQDGLTKQVNCLDDSCSDLVLASLDTLLGLKFLPLPGGAQSAEFRKVIEVEPALRF